MLEQESGDMKDKVYIEDIDGITAGHIKVMQTMMVGGHIAYCHHNRTRAYFVPFYHPYTSCMPTEPVITCAPRALG